MASEIRNPQLWQDGRLKIDWVRHHMPLLNSLEEEFRTTLPFKGLKVALSVHLEAKTAYLCEVLAAGGAEMYVTGSNPLSTQDDVAAALVHAGLNVFAWYDATPEEYEAHIIEKRCPAGVCKALMRYEIIADKCKGCTLCAKKCPVGAISGSIKTPHVIDAAKCIKCGACAAACRFGAVLQ